MDFSDFSYLQLVPFAVFGLFAVGAWLLLDYFAAQKSRTVERLEELRNPALRRPKDAAGVHKKADAVTRVLEKASMASRPLQPKNEFEANKLRAKLASAGFRSEAAMPIYLGLKFLGLVVGFIGSGGTMLLVEGVTRNTLLVTVAVAGGLFYLPTIVLALLIRRRKQAIFLSLPDALDLMVVCVEAGLALDQAMRKVTEELSRGAPVICEELALCNFQMQVGRSRADVLHELGTRTGVDDLRSLSAILIQADKFGSSIAQALRVQSDSMRTRRRQLAEEKAAKTAVKLIFPLVLFIFPGIFVVLVGPAAITIVRQMFPMMTK
jgi:tight adherence protein C